MSRLSKWTDLRLRVKGFILGTTVGLVLALTACIVYAAAGRAANAQREVDRAMRMRAQIQTLRASENEAVSQARAYWITRDEAFAAGVRRELAAFDGTMQSLVQLADNPGQRQILSALAAVERLRVERLYESLTKFRSGVMTGPELRSNVMASDDDGSRMAKLIDALEQDQQQVLDARSGRLDSLRGLLKIALGLGFSVAIASSLLIWFLFAYGIKGRIRSLKQSLARLGLDQYVDASIDDELKAICESLVRTAEGLHQQNLVLENALHGIARADPSGRYLSFNRAFAEIAALPTEEPYPDVFASVIEEDRKKLAEALARMRSEGRAEIQARVVRPDGSQVEVILTVLPISGERDNFYIFLRDNTLQKNAEAALVHAKDAAVASNLAKTSFLAKIGHEIRTPLNAVLGTAELLSETTLNAEQAEYVNIFQRNSRRLVALINDFLDFSKIEAGAVRVDLVPYRIRQAVYDVVETFREPAARKGLSLDALIDTEVPEWQIGDGHRLQQVLTNLLSNAVKFTSSGRVALRAFLTAGPDLPRLRFEVADTGPGIRASDREKIFSPFTQFKDPGAPNQGTGLGLTICRELVQLMNGSIDVTSEEGMGTTFYFELPLQAVDPAAVASPEPKPAVRRLPSHQNQPLRVLIAEDAPDNKLLLQAYLKDQPLILRFADNGQEVINTLKNGEAFDLILMDLDMPVVDGLAATRWVRSWQARAALLPTPIVALSAHAIHEAVRASLDAGCVAHVSKPVDRRTLMDTITRYARAAPADERVEPPPRLVSLSQDIAAMVPKYLNSQVKHIDEARAHLVRHDFDSIGRFGHNLKGTGRGYGFPEIEKMGAELERAAKESGERTITETLDALSRFVSNASARVNEPTSVA